MDGSRTRRSSIERLCKRGRVHDERASFGVRPSSRSSERRARLTGFAMRIVGQGTGLSYRVHVWTFG